MVLTSTERIQEKANMITKMGFNYDLNHTMARKKISELQKVCCKYQHTIFHECVPMITDGKRITCN